MSKLQKKPSALKRGHPKLQNMNFYQLFSTFVGHFCPPGSGSGSWFRIRIRIHWPHWIRIQSGSGSETLVLRSGPSQHWHGGRICKKIIRSPSVADPHHFGTDRILLFTSKRIRILPFSLMRNRIRIRILPRTFFPRHSNAPKWSSKASPFSLWCGSGSRVSFWCGSASSFPRWYGSMQIWIRNTAESTHGAPGPDQILALQITRARKIRVGTCVCYSPRPDPACRCYCCCCCCCCCWCCCCWCCSQSWDCGWGSCCSPRLQQQKWKINNTNTHVKRSTKT